MTEIILEQLRQLAGTLHMLRGRVREAVAGEVGKAVSESVAEVLTATLGGRLVRFTRYPTGRNASYGRSDWDESDGYGWHESGGSARAFNKDEDDSNDSGPSPEAALALACAIGRWWLGRKGSTWGAAGMALVTGVAFLTGGPIARTSLAVLWAVHRLVAATDALGDGAKALDRA